MKQPETLSEAISLLIQEGYSKDFNLREECIHCKSDNLSLSPDEFQIDKIYRFEGDSNPDDSSILYAISGIKHSIKGILVDAYGVYSTALSEAMINKLNYAK